jgi:hypothetical protein
MISFETRTENYCTFYVRDLGLRVFGSWTILLDTTWNVAMKV